MDEKDELLVFIDANNLALRAVIKRIETLEEEVQEARAAYCELHTDIAVIATCGDLSSVTNYLLRHPVRPAWRPVDA